MKTPPQLSKDIINKKDALCLPRSSFPRLVVIGGGFAGLALIEKLKNQPIQVVLLDKNNYHQFQPLLYQVATSGLEPYNIAFPFRKQIINRNHTVFRYANVSHINKETKTVSTNQGKIKYDFLVIATGTKTNFFGNEEIAQKALGMKNILDSLNIRHQMLKNLESAALSCNEKERDMLTNFVIVGGGPAGVETAGALAEFKKYILPRDYPEYPAEIMKIYLVEGANRLLQDMSEHASKKALKYLMDLGVNIKLNEIVSRYDGEIVFMKSGSQITAKNLIWTAGVKGQFPKGIDKSKIVLGNRLKTNPYLQLDNTSNVFAIGDVGAVITEETPKGHPQVAQVAIQQGKLTAKNIMNLINDKPLMAFKYKNKGSLATIGKHKAVADLGKWQFSGFFAWLLWSAVHLISISNFRNKVVVAINWAMSFFSYEKSNRLIILNKKIKN